MNYQAEQTKLNKALLLKALKLTEGNLSKAVDTANVGRTQHYAWLKDDPKYNQAVDDINEAQVDMSEELLKRRGKGYEYTETSIEKDAKGKIVKTVITTKRMAENVDALKTHLMAKGQDRGYGQKIFLGGIKEAPPIEITAIKVVTRKDKSKDKE